MHQGSIGAPAYLHFRTSGLNLYPNNTCGSTCAIHKLLRTFLATFPIPCTSLRRDSNNIFRSESVWLHHCYYVTGTQRPCSSNWSYLHGAVYGLITSTTVAISKSHRISCSFVVSPLSTQLDSSARGRIIRAISILRYLGYDERS